MTIDNLQKNCYGCELCINVCPKNAIYMKANDEGFLYPVVNNSLCIDCGICFKKCPQSVNILVEKQNYFGFSKFNEVLSCSSGGICTYLSKKILNLGGYICGCVYNDEFKVIHIVTNSSNDIEKMKNSKYVQSTIGECYKKIKKLLESNIVLFIGTPCQVLAIKNFIGDNKNLFTIDLICHGVSSPLLFEHYIKYLEKKNNSFLTSFNFRYKKNGIWGQIIKYSFANGRIKIVNREYDKYGSDYKNRVNYRESCYSCKFSFLDSRPGDITVGDFWGIDEKNLHYDKSGVSCFAVNSKKGEFLKKLIDNSLCFQISKENILYKQDALNGPTIRPKERDFYYNNIDNTFFKKKKQPRKKLSTIVSYFIPSKIKKIIKKVMKK